MSARRRPRPRHPEDRVKAALERTEGAMAETVAAIAGRLSLVNYSTRTTDSSLVGTTATAVTSTDVSFTAVEGNRFVFVAITDLVHDQASGFAAVQIRLGSTVLREVRREAYLNAIVGLVAVGVWVATDAEDLTAVTAQLYVRSVASNQARIDADTDRPTHLFVFDAGSQAPG